MRARICSMMCSTFTESERTLNSGITAISLSGWLVDDQGHGQRPHRHAGEQRAIGQEEVRRAAASVAPVDQIQVPKNPVQREGNGEPKPGRAELFLSLGAD